MHVDDGQLNALLDGELDAEETRRVRAHLAECPECARRLEEARAFLTEAGELLGVLTPSADARPLPPRTRIEESGLVAPLARGPAASGSTVKKEGTSEPAVAKTSKEVAVSVDGRTALTPAIRPVQPHEVPKRPARWRTPELEKLAWAASLVLCVAVGYLGHEVLQLRRERALAAGPATQAVTLAPSPATPAASNASHTPGRRELADAAARSATHGGRQPSAPAAERRDRVAAGEPRVKPPEARASKPAPTFTRHPPDQLAAAPANRLPSNAAGAGVDAIAGRAAQAPRAASSEDASGRVNRLDEIVVATAEPAPLSAFRRVTLEEAVSRLRGNPIRQLADLQPIRVEAGPGRLVAGADPAHDVIRVTYADQNRTPFVLDQQQRDAEGSFAGMIEGDTLVTTTASGSMRVRWIDGKFWLSLSGNAGADSLRRLIAKVR